MAKLLIDDGKKIIIPVDDGSTVAAANQILEKEYISYRDRYWGKDINKHSLDQRDGTCIDYDDFFERVANAEIGIYLQINNYGDRNKVEVWAKAYNKDDLGKDIESINKKGEPNKIIITKSSLLESKTEWDKVELNTKKIRIGVGENVHGSPVVFIHLADENCWTNESDNPIRIPQE